MACSPIDGVVIVSDGSGAAVFYLAALVPFLRCCPSIAVLRSVSRGLQLFSNGGSPAVFPAKAIAPSQRIHRFLYEGALAHAGLFLAIIDDEAKISLAFRKPM